MNTRQSLWLFCLLLSLILLQGCKPNSSPIERAVRHEGTLPALTLSLANPSSPTLNSPIEFVIEGVRHVSNPFDAVEADLQIQLVDPVGNKINVGAFWYQAFSPESDLPVDEAGWRARFTPAVSGQWRAIARFHPGELHSREVNFSVMESDRAGFIRVDASHPRYFAYDNGDRFLTLGINMGWWSDDPIENYTIWLDHLAANGGNTIRVWMANWSYALEWNDTPLGDYRARMRQAWLLDELMRMADERGIKVILVLNHHGQFSRTTNPQWQENPYNAQLGGPLDAPEDFVTDPVAIAFFQQRMRYIVDRWASAPNLLAWEWWNEYNFTPISDDLMDDWVVTMEAFLTARDPYDHLVSISGPAGPDSPVWQLSGIDFVSVHIYSTTDPLQFASELAADYAPAVPDKPLLLAEFGYATGEETVDSIEKTGIHMHNGLWATLFSGQSGSGMYWWWDSYVEPLNLWPHFGALSTFLEGVDPAQFVPSQAILQSEGAQNQAQGMLLANEEIRLLWVRNNAYTAASADEAYNAAVRKALRNRERLVEFIYTPTPVIGHTLQVDNVDAENYEVQWFDPQTGTWGESEEVTSAEGSLIIPLPTFEKDIAARIIVTP